MSEENKEELEYKEKLKEGRIIENI